MKKLSKLLCMILACVMILASMPGLYVFAEDNGIVVSGANGDATIIEKGTSMKLKASGVTPGKSVIWSVEGLDGSASDLAAAEQTGALTCILTASADSYGTFKVVATQNDGSGKRGEQVICITSENLVTVDDLDQSIKYVNSENIVWEENSNSSYYLGTGKCVTPPEDDSYPSTTPAYAEFTFTGTGIQWIGETNYFCGIAEVYLDGEKVSTVDPFIAPGIVSQFINFSREGLPYGQHTIKVVAAGLKNPASTQYPGTRVLIDAFRYISGEPQTKPAVVLTGSDSVQPGASFTVGISLTDITQPVYSEDITLSFDPDVFEYESIASADENISIFAEGSDGILRIVGGNTGGPVEGSAPIANVSFVVKGGISDTTSTISVTKALLGVMPNGKVIDAALSSKSITVAAISAVNKTALMAALESARSKYDNAVVGIENGCYWQADKDIFQAAIAAANTVYENPGATQTEVDSATAALIAAINDFDDSAIDPSTGDIDKSSEIDVADLAIAAYYYGADSGSEDWTTAATADINKDGKVDIIDLAFIASRM